MPHWHVLGAGSIGGLWAACLHRAGRAPRLLLKPERLEDYRQAGVLRVGDRSVAIAAEAAVNSGPPIGHLLICCKSHQTLAALRAVEARLSPGTVMVLAQNGLGIAEQIQARLPDNTLLCASTTQGAYRRGPFDIIPAGTGATLVGPMYNPHRKPEEELRALVASLSCEGFDVQFEADILPVLWRKLAINCAINPLTVRYRCRNGELLERADARADLDQICVEIQQLAVALNRIDWLRNIGEEVVTVARATAMNRSSMLQDVEAGRPTEIEAITGYLCQLASAQGVAVPRNTALLEEIRRLDASIDSHPDNA